MTQTVTWQEIYEQYRGFLDAGNASNAPPRYNITPMQQVDFVGKRDGKYLHQKGQWWLVPHWVKEPPKPGEKKYAMFNARVETVAKSPGFRDAFKYGRCIIFADGYYEWNTNPDDGGKDPHYIYLPQRKPFAFAGLWSNNAHLDIMSCSIITAPATGRLKEIHSRMPIILRDEILDKWMELQTSVDDALGLLELNRNGELISHPVDRAVNSNKAEGPILIEPKWPHEKSAI